MINDNVRGWLLKAENDLKIVEHELKLDEKEIVYDMVCFHCEQAVEKYLKSYLVHQNIKFPKTHNLEYLLELCIDKEKDFKKIDVDDLTDYGVEIRYPDIEYYEPEIKDVKKYYKIALKVRSIIFKKFNINDEDINNLRIRKS